MKVIIAGCRDFEPTLQDIDEALYHSGFGLTELVHGGCRGVDQKAAFWAMGRNIKVKEFKADWPKYGRSAGPKRNKKMAKYADALIAFWDGRSKGTANMIREAVLGELPVYIVPLV